MHISQGASLFSCWDDKQKINMVDQGSVCVDGDGLVGGHRGCGKGLYISVAGACGGDGMGVSGEAAISKTAS